MRMHLISVVVVALVLAVPASAAARTRDAERFAALAGAGRARSGVEDPFATGCPAPDLTSFGTSALPSIRLRTVRPNINRLRLTIRARRTVTAHGITATITTSARLVLKR